MSDASSVIAQQFKDGGVVPAHLPGQNAVSKTYVDNHDAKIERKANKAQSDISSHVVSEAAHAAQNITYNGGIIGANNVKQALDNTKRVIDDMILGSGDSGPEVAAARNGYSTLGDRLDSSDAQLADKPNKGSLFSSVKDYEAYGDGVANDSQAIISACNNNELVILPEGEYLATDSLTSTYKSRLVGSGKITGKNTDNWFVNVSKPFASFSERINSYGIQATGTKPFRQTNLAFSQNRDINVCFWGDSISVTGNTIGPSKFKSKMSANNGSLGKAYAPDGVTKEDSYVLKFMDMMMQQFPDKSFNMYNYAIGGTILTEWNQNKTFEATTKAWIDFVKDASPDLLVIGFGMNHSSAISSAGFSYNQKKVMDYIKANFNPIPDVVFVTTPRCIYIPGNADWGTFLHQALRMNAANTCRTMALEQGAYVADVGRLSDIKRIGLDYLKPISKKVDLSKFTVQLTGVTDNGNGTYSFSPNGKMILKDRYMKDFTLRLTLEFNVSNAGSENDFTIHFNKLDSGQTDNRCVINPKTTTVATLNSYLRIGDYQDWTNDGGFQTGGYNFGSSLEGQDIVLTISKKNNVVDYKYGIDELRVIRDIADVVDAPGWIQLAYSSGNGCLLKGIEIFEADYPNYSQTITDDQMYGGYASGDYGVKQPYGGNGVNHPSSIGVQEIYTPCMAELVEDISRHITNSNIKTDYAYYPVTETKSSVNIDGTFSAIDMGLITDYPILTARVVSSGGIVYKLNSAISNYGDAITKLNLNEFGIYNTDGHNMIILKATASSGWQITTYRKS